jgi:hypothetical protein
LAVLFAYLLAPLVNVIDRLLGGKRTRTPALALAYVLVVGLVVLGATQIGSRVVQQANLLAQTFPNTFKGWEAAFQDKVPDSMKDDITKRVDEVVGSIPGYGLRFLALLGNLIYVVIIPVLAFPLPEGRAADEGPYREPDGRPDRSAQTAGQHSGRHGPGAGALHARAGHVVRRHFHGYSIFLTIVGVPYGILIGCPGGRCWNSSPSSGR